MIYVILPLFNRLAATKAFIACMEKQTVQEWRIVFVDDGSTDGTAEFLAALASDRFRTIRGDGQWWWTKSANAGIRAALESAKENDFVLTSNNDVTFGEEYLQTLLTTSGTSPRSVVGSLCETRDGRTVRIHHGYAVNTRFGNAHTLRDIPSGRVVPVDTVSARGTLTPRSVFTEVGFFDETALPHYGADIELFFRAKKAGYSVVVNEKAIVVHHDDSAHRAISTPTFAQKLKKLTDRRSPVNLRTAIALTIKFSGSFHRKVWNLFRLIVTSLRDLFSTPSLSGPRKERA